MTGPVEPSLRAQAVALLDAGHQPASVAAQVGASRTTVYRWWASVRAQRARAGKPEPPPIALSDRQLRILRLRAKGLSGPEIAAKEEIATGTVAHHERVIITRLGAANITNAVHRAWEEGLLRKRPRPQVLPPRHGDRAGYLRHVKAGEEACFACRVGNSRYEVERRAARKAASAAVAPDRPPVGPTPQLAPAGPPQARTAPKETRP
ncbi:LuxR C-terminal-related transcriptional regulator [Actinacidiphila glaucinigra]|uniref:response regulator transcription factor n=1 Tax=Actinacidiphila glaucinigra TaxID=235986 RepID=UPI0032521F7F